MDALLDYDTVAPLNSAALHLQIQQNDDKHEDAHSRLRKDFIALADRVQGSEDMLQAHALRLQSIEQSSQNPTDISRLRFDWRTVVAIVGACVALWASSYQATYGIRTEVTETKAIALAVAKAQEANQKSQEMNQRLQDERYASLKDGMSAMQRLVQLQQYEVQRLNETIARLDKVRR